MLDFTADVMCRTELAPKSDEVSLYTLIFYRFTITKLRKMNRLCSEGPISQMVTTKTLRVLLISLCWMTNAQSYLAAEEGLTAYLLLTLQNQENIALSFPI